MKFFLSILLFFFLYPCEAQVQSYTITKQDTIRLNPINFKKVVALHLDEAIVVVDQNVFLEKLKEERKGLKKQIRSRERIIKGDAARTGIITSQVKSYKNQYSAVDSVYIALKNKKQDTAWINDKFIKSQSSFGEFLPSLLETNKCNVLNRDLEPQKYIIKLTGNKRTGEMTSVNSSFYYLPASKRFFRSKMNWVS